MFFYGVEWRFSSGFAKIEPDGTRGLMIPYNRKCWVLYERNCSEIPSFRKITNHSIRLLVPTTPPNIALNILLFLYINKRFAAYARLGFVHKDGIIHTFYT